MRRSRSGVDRLPPPASFAVTPDQRPDASTIATIAADGSDLRVFDPADTGLPAAKEPTWTPEGRLLIDAGDLSTGVQ